LRERNHAVPFRQTAIAPQEEEEVVEAIGIGRGAHLCLVALKIASGCGRGFRHFLLERLFGYASPATSQRRVELRWKNDLKLGKLVNPSLQACEMRTSLTQCAVTSRESAGAFRCLSATPLATANTGYRIKCLKIAATATATITILSADARRRFGSNSLTATYNTAATEHITMFERLRTKASIIGEPSRRAEVFSSQA
jgi:hypothetical protein